MSLNILVYGCKGYGKTSLAEYISKYFINNGFKVMYIKHIHHGDYKVDYDDKDTGRLLNSGVNAVAAISDTRIYINSRDELEYLKGFISEFKDRFDVLIYEGIVNIDIGVFDYVVNIVDDSCRRDIPYPYKEYIEVRREDLISRFDDIVEGIVSKLKP